RRETRFGTTGHPCVRLDREPLMGSRAAGHVTGSVLRVADSQAKSKSPGSIHRRQHSSYVLDPTTIARHCPRQSARRVCSRAGRSRRWHKKPAAGPTGGARLLEVVQFLRSSTTCCVLVAAVSSSSVKVWRQLIIPARMG